MQGMRAQVMQTEVARHASEQFQIAREKELKAREAAVGAANARLGETRTKAAGTEAELLQTQKEKDAISGRSCARTKQRSCNF